MLECAAGTTAGRLNPRQQQRRPTGNVGFGAEDGGGGDSSSNNSSSRETVLLHLWDEQTCLTSLFRKGDGLVVYWPWLVQQQQPHAQSGDVVLDPAAAMGARAPSQQQSLSSQVRNSIRESKKVVVANATEFLELIDCPFQVFVWKHVFVCRVCCLFPCASTCSRYPRSGSLFHCSLLGRMCRLVDAHKINSLPIPRLCHAVLHRPHIHTWTR